jgi:hypothetical protein
VVSGVEGAGFFWIEREIAEALAGAHFSWTQDQVMGVHGADRVGYLERANLTVARVYRALRMRTSARQIR